MKKSIYVFALSLIILISNINIAFSVGDSSCEEFSPDVDDMGIKDDCNDHCFGSLNESIRLRRMNMDAFDTEYKVIHQWCWIRWFDGDCKFCFFFVGCASTWGPKRTITFTNDELVTDLEAMEPSIMKNVFTRYVCLINYPPKTQFQHHESTYGGTLTVNGVEKENMNITNRTFVCAYSFMPGQPCKSYFINADTSKIGCVHAPIKPGPQTFNKVIPPGTAPIVDNSIGLEDVRRIDGVIIPGYLSLGSKFDQPIIKLDEVAGVGTVEKSITLRYKFPGDPTVYDSKPMCSRIPGSSNTTSFCAKIPEGDPSQVCVCDQAKCNENIYLGCVPRPTPKQSKYRIITEYIEHYDPGTGVASPAANVIFARLTSTGKVRYFDANNIPCAADDAGNKFRLDASENLTTTPAVEPIRYDRLFFPNPNSKIREFYELYDQESGDSRLMRDMATIYGVELLSIIPQFKPAPPENSMKDVFVVSPDARAGTDGCGAFSLSTSNDPFALKYFLPAGNRIRGYCCTFDPKLCTETACRDTSIVQNEDDAVLAFCPGLYNGPVDVAAPDKICVVSEMEWKFIDNDGIDTPDDGVDGAPNDDDQMCSTVPTSCDQVTSPTQRSGYSIWPSMQPGENNKKDCDSNYGLENRKKVKVVLVNSGNSAVEATAANLECNTMNEKLVTLRNTYDAMNLNIPASELVNGTFCQYQEESLQVERICSGGTIGGSIRNNCRFIGNCGEISLAAEFTGWATWPDRSDISSYSQSAEPVTNETTISGTCSSPHAGSPSRVCYTKYQTPAGGANNKLLQWWKSVSPGCN